MNTKAPPQINARMPRIAQSPLSMTVWIIDVR
jgi:hypothetical protein